MGKQERKDRKTRRQKWWLDRAGLLWTDSEEVRDNASSAGWLAMFEAWELSPEQFESITSLDDIEELAASKDLEAAFVHAYNQVILASREPEPEPEPEPEAPRAQVDIGAVAGALPWQSVAMTGGAKPATPWWMWAAPAGLLFLIFQRGR